MTIKLSTIELDMPADAVNQERARIFFATYHQQLIIGSTDAPYHLSYHPNRICRFCQRTEPEVFFRKEAHVIPDFMGNRNTVSDFECDTCNTLFAKYEDSFANYLGIHRTISRIKGKKNKIPKYKDMKTGLTASVEGPTLVFDFVQGESALTLDNAGTSGKFFATKPSYVPIHIIKLLLKVAFCLLEEEEVADYPWLRRFLISEHLDKEALGLEALRVCIHELPGPSLFQRPFAQLFTRIPSITDLVPEKQFVLYYSNFFYQIILPGSLKEMERFKTAPKPSQITVPVFPALVSQTRLAEYGPAQTRFEDFTSSEKRIGEKHTVEFTFERFPDGSSESST